MPIRRLIRVNEWVRSNMYTCGSVKRLIQPVALCVVTVLAVLPAVTFACQWACGRESAGQAHHHHAAQPESMTHAVHHSPAASTGVEFVAAGQPCAHAKATVTAISTLQFKIFAPIAEQAVALFVLPTDRTEVSVAVASHSPPGARSAPLALRI